MRNRVGPSVGTRQATPIGKQQTKRPRLPLTLEWEKRSLRLWTAQSEGRSFRIERAGDASRNVGSVHVIEWNRLCKPIRREHADTVALGKQLVEVWLLEGQSAEVMIGSADQS